MHAIRAPHDDLGIFALMAKALSLRPAGRDTFARRAAPLDLAAAEATPVWRRILDRVDRWYWTQRQRELEAELGKAVDIYDLEARIRDIERSFMNRLF